MVTRHATRSGNYYPTAYRHPNFMTACGVATSLGMIRAYKFLRVGIGYERMDGSTFVIRSNRKAFEFNKREIERFYLPQKLKFGGWRENLQDMFSGDPAYGGCIEDKTLGVQVWVTATALTGLSIDGERVYHAVVGGVEITAPTLVEIISALPEPDYYQGYTPGRIEEV